MPSTIRSSGEAPSATDVGYNDSFPTSLEAPSSLHILSDVSRNDTSLDEHLERDQLGTTINSQMTTLRPTIIIYPTGMLGENHLKKFHFEFCEFGSNLIMLAF